MRALPAHQLVPIGDGGREFRLFEPDAEVAGRRGGFVGMPVHAEEGFDGEGDFLAGDLFRQVAEEVGTARAAAAFVVAAGRFGNWLAVEVEGEAQFSIPVGRVIGR